MRIFQSRQALLTMCAALVLPSAACGDDPVKKPDASDTIQPDTTQPDTTQPDTTQPDTTQPDTTQPDTTEPDTTEPDTTQPDTTQPDTTQPDTTQPDTTEPDTTEPDTTEPDTTQPDTTEPDTTEPDTTEPDTTQPETATLAELLAPFADSANNFETTPNARVSGLVVTILKRDFGTELGGFFAQDINDGTSAFFAPAEGFTAVEEEVAETLVFDVTIGSIKNVNGVPMITSFSDLTPTGVKDDIDTLFQDASAWTVSDWAGKQLTHINLIGTLVGSPVPAGGGPNGYGRFGFVSDGIPEPTNDVQIRFPIEFINYSGMEDGCEFEADRGVVWAFPNSDATGLLQYQPLFVDNWSTFLFRCTPPKVAVARSTGPTTIEITFSRPMDPRTITPAHFSFEPPLQVLAIAYDDTLRKFTLTTDEQTAESYTGTIVDVRVEGNVRRVLDTTDEPIPQDNRTFSVTAGEVQPTTAILYCFENDAGTYIATPTLVHADFANVSGITQGLATLPPSAGGNANTAGQNAPADCTGASKAPNSANWSTAAEFSAASNTYYRVSFDAPAGRLALRFDTRRSGAGPTHFAVWTSVGNAILAQNVAIGADSVFGIHPQWPAAGTEYAFDVPTAGPVELRIYGYGATGATGTFRVDNLTVLFTPAN